jgi:hypothetical protein
MTVMRRKKRHVRIDLGGEFLSGTDKIIRLAGLGSSFSCLFSCLSLGRLPERLLIDFPSRAKQREEREKSCTLFVVYFVHHRWHSDLLSLNLLSKARAERRGGRLTCIYVKQIRLVVLSEYNQLTTLT